LLVALGFSALVIYQNMEYLLTPAKLHLNLWIAGSYNSDGIKNAQLILGAFFAGLLISYSLCLSSRFKNSKIIKSLNTTLNAQMETITAQKSELGKYQDPTSQHDSMQTEVSAKNT